MLKFREITIDDKKTFDSYLKNGEQQCSEMTFTNLFVWRKYYGFRYVLLNETLLLISSEGRQPFAFFPLQKGVGVFSETIDALKEYEIYCKCKKIPCILGRVEQNKLAQLEKSGMPCCVSLDEANSDYVYRTEKLRCLRGKALDGKRNHIHRLEREHIVEYIPVVSENIADASKIIKEWFVNHSQGNGITPNYHPEETACQELLDHYQTLGCRGGLLLIDHIPSAAAFGEMLNKSTAVIHFEKAIHHIEGAYPAINQRFVQEEWAQTEWINREQDLGIKGLRRSKKSYHPDKMIQKYTVYFQ